MDFLIPVPSKEALVPLAGLGLIVLIFFPRIKGMMELNVLRSITDICGPLTDVNPRPIYSKQNYLEAAQSVQRALAHNHRAKNWSIKVVQIPDPIEKAIRVTGNTTMAPSLNATPTTVQSDPKAAKLPMQMTVQVDVYQAGSGSRIVWKYIPADPSEFQRRVQMSDRNVGLLMGRTNYSMIRQLHAKGTPQS